MIPGYKFFHLDREERMGGGVAMYVSSNMNPSHKQINGIEAVCVGVFDNKNSEVLLITAYRPPHRSVQEDNLFYSTLTRKIKDKTCIVMGDFNCRNVNWDTGTTDAEGERLLEFANDNFLIQKVRENTRGDNILDLIFTSDIELIYGVTTREHLANSDHLIVEFTVNIDIEVKKSNVQKLNYRKANWEDFRKEFLGFDLTSEITSVNWNLIKDKINNSIKKHIPSMICGGNQNQPKWYSREIGTAIKTRNSKYKLKKTNPSLESERQYIEAKRNVKILIKSAKREEEIRIARSAKENPKEFFAYVNAKKNTTRDIGPLTNDGVNLTTDDNEISKLLNDYFCTVFTTEDIECVPTPDYNYVGEGRLSGIQITPDMVEKKISKLNKCEFCQFLRINKTQR